MKYLFSIFFPILLLSCQPDEHSKMISAITLEGVSDSLIVYDYPEWVKKAVIYEVNTRQYTEEGTFNAFAEHLPRLQEMGVDILRFMPLQSISKEERKGNLGDNYSISDYKGINPTLGTADDFRKMVKQIHDLDMRVIIDWSIGQGNYEKNSPLRESMTLDMAYWVKEFEIDGFRCASAATVPADFWQETFDKLNGIKPLFFIAEGEKPSLVDEIFDAYEGKELVDLMAGMAVNERPVSELDTYLQGCDKLYGPKALRINYTSDHAENALRGSVFERCVYNVRNMAVLSFTAPGIPMIYGGQEAIMDKRLPLYEKDAIDWSDLHYEGLYTSLIALKHKNKALWHGAQGGTMVKITDQDEDEVYGFKRERDGNVIVVILNLSRGGKYIRPSIPLNGMSYVIGKRTIKDDGKFWLAGNSFMILRN